ncbi:hypothetical protein D9M68_483630 [compost metagenome]
MSTPTHLDLAEAMSTRACQEAGTGKTAVLPCGATLHVGCFFDGFARDLEQDLRNDRVSNVGRLFLAHPFDQGAPADPFIHKQKFYISGLGAPFDPTLGGGSAVVGSGLKGAAGKARDNLGELPAESATEAGVAAATDILGGKKWWERLVNNLKPDKLLMGVITAVATAGVEAVAEVRDNEQVAELFKSGVDTRLEAAVARFENIVNEASAIGDIPLKRIAVSIYGFDFGATLARAFCHKLFAECGPGTTRYKGLALDVVFAGLFDAVDRSMSSSIVWEYLLPLVNRVDDGECLPGPVKAALHLVAAHECRDTRRARLIGTGPFTPRWQERLVPGISEDVGGGLRREDSPSSRELHLACLHEMYRAAYRAGVPFPPLEELHEVDTKAAGLFVLNDHINGISALDAKAGYEGKAGAQSPGDAAFLDHRRLYIRHLRGLWQMYREQSRAFDEEEARLERPVLGSGGILARHLGLGNESAAQAARRDRVLQEVRANRDALRQQLGWLEQVEAEARRLRYGINRSAVEELLDEWFAATSSGPGFAIEDLLEFFLNDRYMVSRMEPSDRTPKYFAVRDFDTPNPLKTRGTLPNPLEHVRG